MYYFLNLFFTLLNLLGWYWLIKLYRFQVCNATIRHLYIVLCVHHPRSSLLSSPLLPYTPSTFSPLPFPPVIPILISVSMRFLFFIPSPFFTQHHNALPSDSCQSVLYLLDESVSILFVNIFCPLDSTCEWNHVFLFLWLAYFGDNTGLSKWAYGSSFLLNFLGIVWKDKC